MHQIPRLIETLYRAPGTDAGWQTFLQELRHALSGSSANWIAREFPARRSDVTVFAGGDPEGIASYERYWGVHDPWALSPHLVRRSGTIFVGDELISPADFARTPFYNDFARHFDVVRVVGVTLEAGDGKISVLTINGSKQRRPFAAPEQRLMAALVPHLQNALQLHRRLMSAEARTTSLSDLLHRARDGVLLLNQHGRVVFMNATAVSMVNERDGLEMIEHELRCHDVATTTRLRTLVSRALAPIDGPGDAGGHVVVQRRSGRRPYSLLISRLGADGVHLREIAGPVAVICVADTEVKRVPAEAVLQMLLGITPAEARLIRVLADGHSLEEAGSVLGIRPQTARSRLKAVFEKTGTSRQAELIVVVHRLARLVGL